MERSAQLAKIYGDIGKIITSSLKLEDILSRIMELVYVFYKPANWSLLRLDPATNELFFVIISGVDISKVENLRLQMGKGIAGTVVQEKKSMLVPDVSKDPRFNPEVDMLTGFRTHSIIAVPMIYRDEVFGVIELINATESGSFLEEDISILETIAGFAALAFANSALYDNMGLYRMFDRLTGVYNYQKLRTILDRLETANTFSRRELDDREHDVIVAYIDIDNFHHINEVFGNKLGDWLLKDFSSRLKTLVREEDFLFRVGGDEFLILIFGFTEGFISRTKERVERVLGDLCRFYSDGEYQLSLTWAVESGYSESCRGLVTRVKADIDDKKRNIEY